MKNIPHPNLLFCCHIRALYIDKIVFTADLFWMDEYSLQSHLWQDYHATIVVVHILAVENMIPGLHFL
jgi:hypothetical protein